MPKFRVLITADVTASCTVEVEADDVAGAMDAAIRTARDKPQEWELDDAPAMPVAMRSLAQPDLWSP